MPHSPNQPAFFKGLDRAGQLLASIGLVVSAGVFGAGMAGLVYVAIHVLSTSPPSIGSQGEWVYAGVACLLVAGWGFSQAAKFLARLRTAETPVGEDVRTPRIQIGAEGLSIDLPPVQPQNAAAKRSSGGFTWSFTSNPLPLTTFRLDEAQLAAADAAAGSGADWDAVCRRINPAYAALSDVEQSLFRHAVQSAIEDRRGRTRG